jgi:hypothetical protein
VGEMKEEGTAGARLRGAARGERPWRGSAARVGAMGGGWRALCTFVREGFSVT